MSDRKLKKSKKKGFVSDREGNYTIDGVSYGNNKVIVASDASADKFKSKKDLKK